MSRIRWGVLGTGNIVGKMGPAIQRANNSIWFGVAGRNEENGRQAAAKYGVARAYRSYQELIDDPAIDAVYIALLNHLHCEWAVKAIEAGKHVLCEKPFTMNTREALLVQEAAAKSDVQVMEAFVWRFHPAHLAAKEMVNSGAIGKPVMMSGHFSFTANPASTRLVKEWGGGSLYDIGCYPISWSRFFMDGEPEAVDCGMTIHPQTGVDMRCTGTLYFPGGRTAQISSSFDMGCGSFYEIWGTKGRLSVQFTVTADALTNTVTAAGETKQWTTDRIEPYRWQVEAFADCILNRKPVPYGIGDAVANMKIIDALFEADRTKRRVAVQ